MMKLFIALVIFASSAFARAQADFPALPRPTVEQVPAQALLTPETNLMAEMLVSIDAGKAKPGDVITARVRSDTLEARQILLLHGATLIGHVRDVRGRSKEQPRSMLSVYFDKMRLKDGAEIPVNLLLYQLATPKAAEITPEETQTKRPDDDGLYSNKITRDRMAPVKNPIPDNRLSMGEPERNQGAYSPAARPPIWEHGSSDVAMPPAPSGLDGVTLAAVRQHTASFAVLTSDARNIKVSKHDLIFFRIFQEKNPDAGK